MTANRFKATFETVKKQNRAALVSFIVAGDPDQKLSQQILNDLPQSGADIVELGMPFTDPMADGPAIQAGALRALQAGMDVIKTLSMAKEFRAKNPDTPLVLMGYYNPVYRYGVDQFCADAASSGVDGLIIVDLPPEEVDELKGPAQKAGLDIIRLATPTTDASRLSRVLEGAGGFLYYVSITGVTGTASASADGISKHLAMIKSKTNLPIAVGFGIRTPDDARNMSKIADAVVVGSAFVQLIEKTDKSNIYQSVTDQVRAFRAALA